MAWLIQNNAQFQVQTTTILEALPGLIEDLQDYDAEALDLYDEALNDTRSTVDDQDAGTEAGSSVDAATENKSSEDVSDATDNVSDTGKMQQRQITVRIQQMMQVPQMVQMPQTQQMIQTAQMQQIPVIHRHSAGRILKNMMCLW